CSRAARQAPWPYGPLGRLGDLRCRAGPRDRSQWRSLATQYPIGLGGPMCPDGLRAVSGCGALRDFLRPSAQGLLEYGAGLRRITWRRVRRVIVRSEDDATHLQQLWVTDRGAV